MGLSFNGGQALPAQGTAAYNAAAAAPSGTGSYNASTGVLSSGGSVVYAPNSNASVPQTPSAITGANTAPSQPIPIPQTAPQANLTGLMVGNNQGLVGNGVSVGSNGLLKYEDPTQKIFDEGKSNFDSMIRNIKAPVKTADIYAQEYAANDIQGKSQQVQNFTNQLNTIVAKSQADQLSETGQGRGIPEAIIGGRQAQIAKEAAIQALPVQAQLAAAQGNLQLAQQHLDTVFKLKAADAEAENNFYNKQIELAYNFFDGQQQKKLASQQDTTNKNFQLLTNQITYGQQLATKALEAGDAALAARISSAVSSNLPSQNSPTFAKDLSDFTKNINSFTGQIKPVGNTEVIEVGGQKLLIDKKTGRTIQAYGADNGASGGGAQTLTAFASQYSETGKLPSPSDLKPYGITIGQVTSAAKEAPKPVGAIVSASTGVKPSSLSATQQEGVTAMSEIVNQTLPALKEKFPKLYTGVLGGLGGMVFTTQDRQDYLTFRQEFLNKLLKARSGATVTPQEYDRYAELVPSTFNQPFGLGSDGSKKLQSLETSMKQTFDTYLNSNQLSVYGYSKVNVNGTPRTVGEVLNIGGSQYRVLPDGTLTDQL